jgi:cytosine deaminase
MAVEEAERSRAEDGVPEGAMLVKEGEVIASSRNRSRQINDPIAVAEMECIREAGRRSDQRQLTLYTTRYPDMLVAGTILQFSIGSIVIGLPEISNDVTRLLREKGVPVLFEPLAECESLNLN